MTDLIWNTRKEIKKSMIKLDWRFGLEEVMIRRFSPQSFSFLSPPCSFALFLSLYGVRSDLEWMIPKMGGDPALNSLCHDLNPVRRHPCTARTNVVRPGRTWCESCWIGQVWYGRTKSGAGRTRESKMPFLRVVCSNPAENNQTLSSTKF
jgi:hypothetical protein